MVDSRLFRPLKVGNITLQHRIAMAPLTRFRADDNGVPLPFVAEYYAQRASTPGTLITSEATYIHPRHGGYPNAPGIYSEDQIEAWKKVTQAVHQKGSFIYLQLWALGRAAASKDYQSGGVAAYDVLSSSTTRFDEELPFAKAMTVEDIKQTVQEYAQAAKNAIAAGFDGVEIHGANGYLIDQFTQDTANERMDLYGGSIENRSRFATEVTEAVVEAVGASRTAIRLSPWSSYQGMRMQDPVPQFTDLLSRLDKLNLSHVHLVEGRVKGNTDIESNDSLDFAFDAYKGTILLAGGFTSESAKKAVDEQHKDRDVVVVFGRYFTSNPDLVSRVREGVDFTKYDRDTFYDVKNPKGYVDWPARGQSVSVKA
jgi:NADPH2 dehydrogenase